MTKPKVMDDRYVNEEQDDYIIKIKKPTTYIIATRDRRYIKVGKATDVLHRLHTLQTGNPKELVIIAETHRYTEDKLMSIFMSRFSDCYVRGSWFRPSLKMCMWIREKLL